LDICEEITGTLAEGFFYAYSIVTKNQKAIQDKQKAVFLANFGFSGKQPAQKVSTYQ
jgi:hypothetical protein